MNQVLDVGATLKQREGNLGGGVAALDMPDQQIDDGRPTKRTRQLVGKGRQVLHGGDRGSFRKDRGG